MKKHRPDYGIPYWMVPNEKPALTVEQAERFLRDRCHWVLHLDDGTQRTGKFTEVYQRSASGDLVGRFSTPDFSPQGVVCIEVHDSYGRLMHQSLLAVPWFITPEEVQTCSWEVDIKDLAKRMAVG